MRNFSTLLSGTFVSYDVNGEEYVSPVDYVFPKVCVALAQALEVGEIMFRQAMVLLSQADGVVGFLSPSECDVISEFLAFHRQVTNLEMSRALPTQTPAFVYHNLNTGRSVVWTHIVI